LIVNNHTGELLTINGAAPIGTIVTAIQELKKAQETASAKSDSKDNNEGS
jgi:hypothetical protein